MAIDDLLAHYLTPIGELLADQSVNDIFIDRFDHVYVSRNGQFHPVDAAWTSETALTTAVNQIAIEATRVPLGPANPVLDARLADGSRVAALVAPLVAHTSATIRVARSRAFSLDDLLQAGMLSPDMATVLAGAIQSYANVIISGSTDSGKTTLLRALLAPAVAGDRVFVVEDTRELRLQLVRGVELEVTRHNDANLTMRDAIKSALRNAPTRIVVGEIRDDQALNAYLELLEAGFRGGITTLHAGSAQDTLFRAEMMLMRAGQAPTLDVARSIVRRALSWVAYCEKSKLDGRRRVAELAAIHDGDAHLIWAWNGHAWDCDTVALRALAARL